jgi:hypothetical protein
MPAMANRLPARALAGCGVVACLALSGAAPATNTTTFNGATAKTAAAVATAGPAGANLSPVQLDSVAAVSAHDVWAVGTDFAAGVIMHWNGTRWSRYPNPTVRLTGVAARSAADVWAVGGTVALHWNGRSWTRVRTPALKGSGYLSGVAATSAGNAWTVGQVGPAPGSNSPAGPLVEHWNGRQWTVQRSQPLPGGGQFSAVAALSAANAWAVGSAGAQTLVEHWNGTSWSRWASPNVPGALASSFNSVTVIAANNAWAVGTAVMPSATISGGIKTTLTAFWNGRRWLLVASPNVAGAAELFGVTASWTHNIWAVGDYNPEPACQGDGCDPALTLIMHWNGTRWKVVPSPNPQKTEAFEALYGVAAVTRDDIWAVGTNDGLANFIVAWNGTAWSPSAPPGA